MKKYRVWARTGTWVYSDIEAETDDEAIDIAELADGGDFIENPEDGYFEVSYAEELSGNSG